MAKFTTHTGLVVEWSQPNRRQLITITGDRVKVLYEGDNLGEAAKVYREVQAHYIDRKNGGDEADVKRQQEVLGR